ncbi:MAG: sodium/proton-translocating pyrophosphatase, partial [Chloroflexi bacterium]|nr:sodium/proton-translocating pyrophosphatase [Chloroflexota bacterium]
MNELIPIEQTMLWGVMVVAFISLVYAYWLWKQTIARDKGTQKMQDVWLAIKAGAEGYLRKQLRTISLVVVVLTVIIFLSVYIIPPSREAVGRFGDNAVIIIAVGRTLAFILGAAFSTIVGQLGMRVAIEGNIRVAAEAVREDYNGALTVAY